MILISFYHLPHESNHNHLNHTFRRTREKESMCFVGMFVSVRMCTQPAREKEINWLSDWFPEEGRLWWFFLFSFFNVRDYITFCPLGSSSNYLWSSLDILHSHNKAAVRMTRYILVLSQKVGKRINKQKAKQNKQQQQKWEKEKTDFWSWASFLELTRCTPCVKSTSQWLPFKFSSTSEQRNKARPKINDGAQRPASVLTAEHGHSHVINQVISYETICILYHI